MGPTPSNRSLSHAVVEAVAEAEGVDPVALRTPLYEAIDPDALDAVFESADESPPLDGRVFFEYYGYTVAVASDGTVALTDEDELPT